MGFFGKSSSFGEIDNGNGGGTAISITGSTNHIKNTVEEMNAISNPKNADICHVTDTDELYMYQDGVWLIASSNIPDATTEIKGVVKLSDNYRDESEDSVPTSKVLSTVYNQTTEAFSGLAEYVLGRTVDARIDRKGIVQLAENFSSDSSETVPTSKVLYDLYTMFLRNFNNLSEYVQTKTSDATVESKGIVQLDDGYESESTETVPTSRAVNEMFNALVATVMGLAEYLNEHVDDSVASTDNFGHVKIDGETIVKNESNQIKVSESITENIRTYVDNSLFSYTEAKFYDELGELSRPIKIFTGKTTLLKNGIWAINYSHVGFEKIIKVIPVPHYLDDTAAETPIGTSVTSSSTTQATGKCHKGLSAGLLAITSSTWANEGKTTVHVTVIGY